MLTTGLLERLDPRDNGRSSLKKSPRLDSLTATGLQLIMNGKIMV
jgi:hypothetical protein